MPGFVLPDVDDESYKVYAADQFQKKTEEKVQSFGADRMIGDRIASLDRMTGAQQATPPPAPAQAPSAGPVDALGSWREQVMGQALSAIDRAGGDVQAFASQVSGALSKADPQAFMGEALAAAERAGGDVQTFASSLRLPDPPRPSAPEPAAPAPPTAGQAQSVPRGGDLRAYARQAAARAGLDVDVFERQINQESGFKVGAASGAGARGIAQIVPEFHPDVDPSDPYASLDYAANLMAGHLKTYGGDYSKALAAYNAGPGAVAKHGGVPPFEETQTYIRNILGGLGRAAQPFVEGAKEVGRSITGEGDPQWLTLAKEQLNKPYIWGSASGAGGRGSGDIDPKTGLPRGFDCSGYVAWVLQKGLGVDLPAFTGSAYEKTQAIGADQARPGDIVFYNMNNPDPHVQHMAIYIGDGKIIQAGGTARNVNIADVGAVGTPEFRRAAGTEAADARSMVGGALQGAASMVTDAASSAASRVEQQLGEWESAGRETFERGRQFVDEQLRDIDSRIDSLSTNPNPYIAGGAGGAIATNPSAVLDRGREFVEGTGRFFEGVGTDVRRQQREMQQLNPYMASAPGGGFASAAEALTSGLERAGLPGSDEFGFEAGPLKIGPREVLGAAPEMLLPSGQVRRAAVAAAGAAADLAPDAARLARSRLPAEAEAGFAAGMPTGGVRAADAPRYESIMPEGTFDLPPEPAPGLLERAEQVRTAFVRQMTDRGVDLAKYQQDYAKAVGRALNADEMASELSRLDANGSAKVLVDRSLRPAVQEVGDDYEALRDLVTLRTNMTVADTTATKVQATGADRNVPTNLTAALNDANTSVRMRQQAIERMGESAIPDDTRMAVARRSLAAAERKAESAQAAIDTWRQSNIEQASTEGIEAGASRMFSGGINKAESEARLGQLRDQLGPERFAKVEQAAERVFDHSRGLRERLVQAGVMNQEQADQLDVMYPEWAKTRVLEYMDDAKGGGQRAGTKVGLGSRELNAYTIQGTKSAREDPIASTVAYTHQVERMARKNEAFQALLKIDQGSPEQQLRRVAADYTPRRGTGEETVQGFVNGEKVKYVTNNKALVAAINGSDVLQLPDPVRWWGNVFRSLATSRNPLFLAANAALDIPQYTLTTMAREGGSPLKLHQIWGELLRGYADAFQGLASGTFKGEGMQRYMLGGGAQSGAFGESTGKTAQTLRDLQRKHVWSINSADDAKRILKDILLLKPVEGLGERIEAGPRIAAMRMAEKRGANQVQAVIEGRTVTMDFAQGGALAKVINQVIPFFNVGVQGPMQVARTFRGNPRGFATTVGTLIGGPTVAIEAWNRLDAQRAQDYADVPDYLKDTGWVIMLPTEAPVDEQGNRRPEFVHVNLRNWSTFSTMARSAAELVAGDRDRDWQEILGASMAGAMPLQAKNLGDLAGTFMLPIPGASSALQLAVNHDLYRNRSIVNEWADQNASAIAKALTPWLQSIVDQVEPGQTVRPSAVDFAIRDTFAGVGSAALGASNVIAPGERAKRVGTAETPVVGGVLGRFVKGQTGQQIEDAREDKLTPSAREILRAGGVSYAPSQVQREVSGVPLKLTEQAEYQRLANRYVDDAIQRVARSAAWQRYNPTQREELVQSAAAAARERAGVEVLRKLSREERRARQQSAARELAGTGTR
jgi:hypothetical protein